MTSADRRATLKTESNIVEVRISSWSFMYQSGSLLEQNNAKERNQRVVCRSKKKTEWWRDLLAVIIVVSIQDMVWTE